MDTQLSALDSLGQIQPVLIPIKQTENNNSRKSGIQGSFRRSETMPRLSMSNQVDSSKPFVHKEAFSVKSYNFKTLCSVDIPSRKLPLHSDHGQFYEKTRKTSSVPKFQDKWQFPRYTNQIQVHKYLSL